MQSLIFATNNEHKVTEMQSLLQQAVHIVSLREAGIDIDIPEPYETIEKNAVTKARTIFARTQQNCFSEDTGLEVMALNNAPGVHSARYAGAPRSDKNNMEKLLDNLQLCTDRSARFVTIIALIFNTKQYLFTGMCSGKIATGIVGKEEFGYDPIFIPNGATKTFAQMSLIEKNKYSHRAKAAALLLRFLQKQTTLPNGKN